MFAATYRGNALPETALVVSLMLMITLAAIDLASIGYSQAQADGAAFVGARTLAVANSTSAPLADSAISGVFPKVQSNTVVVKTTTGSYVGAQVTLAGQPIHLLTGVSSPSTQIGHTYETTLGTANPLTSIGSVISDVPCAVVTLDNIPANSQSVRIAQNSTSTTGGNGTNADFGEFSVHEKVYVNLALTNKALFPSGVTLATASANLTADLLSPTGIENTMRGWDLNATTAGFSTYPAADPTCTIASH